MENAKSDAKSELESYLRIEDYAENKQALLDAVTAGKGAIEAATTLEEVETALADAKAVIDAIEADVDLLVSIEVNSLPTKLNYLPNEFLDLEGGKLRVTDAKEVDSLIIAMTDPRVTVGDFDSSVKDYGPQTITLMYDGAEASFTMYLVRFPDVPYDYKFYENIMDLTGRGIVKGYSDGRYGAGDSIKRSELSVMIARALDLPLKPLDQIDKESIFPDSVNHSQRAYIAAVKEAGIFGGDS